MRDEQRGDEFLSAADGGNASTAVLRWNGNSVERRHAPALPIGDIGFSNGSLGKEAARPLSEERITGIIAENVAAARAQASALPVWLRLDENRAPSPVYLALKRTVDVTVALTLMLLLFPVLLFIGLCVALEDRGPILYYQTRVGRNGKTFRFYKFRSMVRNADALKAKLAAQNEASGPVFKMKNDPRVTRIGRILRKTSLDELPQLMNVLRGEMSLVGPRPQLPREVEEYEDWHFARQQVQPGLLCLREVLGRSNLTFDQWVAYDLLYIRNRSVRTDLWILFRLIPAVLKADGAY